MGNNSEEDDYDSKLYCGVAFIPTPAQLTQPKARSQNHQR